jgi:short-subunit dehydrogenase
MSTSNIHGRHVILVTGASSGIGAALTMRAVRSGYAVVAAGRNAESLDLLRISVEAEGGSIAVVCGDVRDQANAEALVKTAFERFGRIDVVVANAGIAARGPILLQNEDELAEQIDTHLYAPIRLIRVALPLLNESKGAVFVLGSGVARIPIGGMGLYPASKAAVRSATRTLRAELRPFGIGVSYVDPGVVDTPFMERKGMSGAPSRLMISPHTVARAIIHAIPRRPAEVNASPWQTASVALAELFPRITDFVLARADSLTGVSGNSPLPTEAPSPIALASDDIAVVPEVVNEPVLPETSEPEAPAHDHSSTDALAMALEPFLGRMERTKLPLATLTEALRHGEVFSEDDFALSWAGMPNKNERKLLSDICLGLQHAGILMHAGERAWMVRRAS